MRKSYYSIPGWRGGPRRSCTQPSYGRRRKGTRMNNLWASARIAIDALKVNKMRSGLTMLGIIIGVAAVIAMVAVGSGASERIQQQIASIGSNVIVVMPGSLTTSGIRLGAGFALTLTLDDSRAIGEE